ncbi:ParB/RepB/Spo0J family partition protein [candidate division KSB1 bacterium]|nr:ParB/RepB/Spo0J family partition protein [candidate division KSB1 bacterium]
MANRKALGRGLKALIPDVPEGKQENNSNIQFIEVVKVSPNPFQPRETFDQEKYIELKNSIAEKGIVQPITVRRYNDGYQLIAGERRLRSVSDLGLNTIPAFIIDVESDEEMMELSIIENIHREDLNPIDIANSYKRLIEECNLTQESVAQKVGKDRATVANFLRLLKLPKPIQESLQSGEITMGHARAILSLEKNKEQIDLWKKTVKNSLSVRKVEQLVRGYSQKKKPAAPATLDTKTYYIEDAENKLRTKLTTKVLVKPKKKGGVIEIEYYTEEDLNRLIAVIYGE